MYRKLWEILKRQVTQVLDMWRLKVRFRLRYKILIGIALFVLPAPVIFDFYLNGFCVKNTIYDRGFWVNLTIVLITFSFGVFTFIAAKTAAAPKVLFTIKELGMELGKKLIRIPCSIRNDHGLSVAIRVFAKIVDKDGRTVFEPLESNEIYRGKSFVLPPGQGFKNSRIDFSGKTNILLDGYTLVVEVRPRNQFALIKKIRYFWYFDCINYPTEYRWVFHKISS